MKIRHIVCTLALVTLPLAIGCGSSNSAAPTTSVLDGTWARSCNSGSNGIGGSLQQKIVYGSGNYSYTETVFNDSSCAGTVLFVLTESGTFAVGGADATTPAGTDITYTQSAVTGTTQNGEGATLTTAAPCGGSVSFTDGTATSISGLSCNFFGGGAVSETANAATIANLFQISGTTLTLGHTSGNEFLGNVAPAAAPTLLTGKTLTKQ